MSIPVAGAALPKGSITPGKHEPVKNVSPARRPKSADSSRGASANANVNANANANANQRKQRNEQNFKQNGRGRGNKKSRPVNIPRKQQDTNTMNGQNGSPAAGSQAEDTFTPRRSQRLREKAAAAASLSSDAVPLSKAQRQANNNDTSLVELVDVTPVKPAYAGPTFHASPAASALPMPKFLSKSVPDPNAGQGLEALVEKEEAACGHETRAIDPRHGNLSAKAVQSPLEIFFKADREEKARRVVSSRDRNSPSARGSPLSIRHQTTTDRDQSAASSPFKRPVSSGQYGKEMFMMELNDNSAEYASTHKAQQQHRHPGSPDHVHQGQYSKVNRTYDLQQQVGNGVSLDSQQSTSPSRNEIYHAQARNQAFDTLTSNTKAAASQRHNSYGPTASTPSTNTKSTGDQYLYGNRNLSPIFNASKADGVKNNNNNNNNVKLTSGLRREVTDSLISFKDINPSKPSNSFSSKKLAERPRSSDHAAAAAISRNYLQAHIQGSPDVNANYANGNNAINGHNGINAPSLSSLSSTSNVGNGQMTTTHQRPHTVNGSMNASSSATDIPQRQGAGVGAAVGQGNARTQDRHGAVARESLSKLDSVANMEKDLRKLLKMKIDGD